MQNGHALVEMNAQGPEAAGPSVFSTPPRASPRNSSLPHRRALDPDDGFLGTIARWSEDGGDDVGSTGTARTSHLVGIKGLGLSPPPLPGPPPTDPPPLPPPSSHPFAGPSRTSAAFPRTSRRLSSGHTFRKAPTTPPSHPPPAEGLPPTPTQSSSSSPFKSKVPLTPGERNRTPSLSSNVAKHSSKSPPNSPPVPISQRNTSLLDPAQLSLANEPFSSSATAGPSRAVSNQHAFELRSPPARRSDASKPPRTPSRHLLQSALDLAQRAVEMDKNNDVIGALAAYREAVGRLKSVMERVGVEPAREDGKRRQSAVGKSEEEGRTLRGIHDAYVARIQLLSSYGTDPSHAQTSTAGSDLAPNTSNQDERAATGPPDPVESLSISASNTVPSSPNAHAPDGRRIANVTPRPSMEEGAYGIGNLMLATPAHSFNGSLAGSPAFVAERRLPDTRSGTSTSRSSVQLPPPLASEGQPPRSRLSGTGSASPLDFALSNTQRRDSLSLQEALDEVANNASSSSVAPIVPPPRRESMTNSSIGLGHPTSNPILQPSSSRPTSNSMYQSDQSSRPASQESRAGSWRRPSRPSVGIETELSLDQGEDGLEVLARTPQGPASPSVTGSRTRPNSLSLGQTESSSTSRARHSFSAQELVDRPLPPLPDSAPLSAGADQGAEPPRIEASGSRPNSGSGFLVNHSTAQGTISQRRQSRVTEGMASISEMASPPRGDIEGLPRSAPFPVMPSDHGHQRAITSPSLGQRVRSRSQPGHRHSQPSHQSSPSEGDIPPLPALRINTSFSSQPPTASDPGHRLAPAGSDRFHPDSLAPPISFHSHNGASPGSRSLPPLTGIASAGSGSLLSPLPEAQPADIIHRPFHLLRILCLSMDPESSGSYLTGAIHISSAVWKPANWAKTSSSSGPTSTSTYKPLAPPKILAQDVKVRVIEALCVHFEIIRQTGAALLEGPRETRYGAGGPKRQISTSSMKILMARTEDFMGVLEGLDEEMEASHKVLTKAGVALGSWKGKKTGSALSWGSRITKTMDKMTNGKAMDSPDKYVDLLSHLCFSAQVIDEHLGCFTGPCTGAYHALPEKVYRQIGSRITRAAEFVGAVVVPFILDDFKQFFLRYLKGGVRYLED